MFHLGVDCDDQDDSYDEIGHQIRLLEAKLRKLDSCPEGASLKNGGNRIYKNWILEKKETSEKLEFFKRIPKNNLCRPIALINVQENFHNRLLETFKTRPFVVDVDKLKVYPGYVIINNLNINKLKTVKVENDYILKNIQHLVLFDCESSVKKFADYHYDFISNLNKNHGTHFQYYFILTFGKSTANSNYLKKRIELVNARFKIPQNSTYSLLSKEVIRLANQESGRNPSIVFHGELSSTFWNVFDIETKIRDLYELRSIKMLNIYSLAFNEDIKNYIIEDLFNSERSSLLTGVTKQTILESSKKDIDTIRESLSSIIDLIIQSNWVSEVSKSIHEHTSLLIPEEVIKNNELKSKIADALQLTNQNKLTSWNTVDVEKDSAILILAYKDQGRYPYYFYPNINESLFKSSYSVKAIFLKTFFGVQYEWSVYNLNKETYRLLDHPIRRAFFHWNDLEKEIKSLKPSVHDPTIWDFESDYANVESRTVVKVKFKGTNRAYTFSPSDLFILQLNKDTHFKVEKIIDLIDYDLTEEILEIQNLDEIQNEINVYDKFIDSQPQDDELKIIRNQFKIDDTEPGRLWKVLLKNVAAKNGETTLYNEIKEYLKKKNLKMVSFYHFKQCWINPDSVSMSPLSNRVFIELCTFLSIPKSYFIIMQRIKNSYKQASRQSNSQMNNLLKISLMMDHLMIFQKRKV